jgi:hypothetical protein
VQVWRSVQFPANGPLSLQSIARSMALAPDKGTVSPTGTLCLLGRAGRGVNLFVHNMGRVRQCTPMPRLNAFISC